jgi:hypothetical protein
MSLIGMDRVFADFLNAIASPALKEIAQHWRDICRPDRLPGWKDIRPSAIKKHLPIVWCYDYDAQQDDFIGRLAGIEITGVSSKPFKGTRLSELRPKDVYPRSLMRAKRVVEEPAFYCGRGVVYKTAEQRGYGERIVMPLRADGNDPAGIFGASEYKSRLEWFRVSTDPNAEEEAWFSLAEHSTGGAAPQFK